MSKKQKQKPKNLTSNLGPFWGTPSQRPLPYKHTMSTVTTTLPSGTQTVKSPVINSAYTRAQAQQLQTQALNQTQGRGTPKAPPQPPPQDRQTPTTAGNTSLIPPPLRIGNVSFVPSPLRVGTYLPTRWVA